MYLEFVVIRHGKTHRNRNKYHAKSLAIREIQIKTTLRYHLTPVRMAKIDKARNNNCWRGCRERGSLFTAGGNASWYRHSGKLCGGPLKI